MDVLITGIQQVGIGVEDAGSARDMYKKLMGMDTLIFDDKSEASLMTRYTGTELHSRHAILSMNMGGGGGFEIWQFTSRSPQKPHTKPQPGDTGIFAVKIKTPDPIKAHRLFSAEKNIRVSRLQQDPGGSPCFWIEDEYGNHFQLTGSDEWFKPNHHCGGVAGAVIGVSNMDTALPFYQQLLGIQEPAYDITSAFHPMNPPADENKAKLFRRVLLQKKKENKGAFSTLLGGIQVELVQALQSKPEKIFAGRFWGDYGFIHLCFDVLDMDALKSKMENAGYPFTVDSANSFAMGDAAGRFCYLEDPDGTLIELVETHKIPILKKIGWYLNLKKRKHNRPLPGWMLGMLALNKIK